MKHSYDNIIFITGNASKLKEVSSLLAGIRHLDVDLPEIQDLDGKNIIAEKAKAAFAYTNGPVIVDDTSLYLDCLAGAEDTSALPGPYIKWFLQGMKNTGLVALAQKLGNTRARAQTMICYARTPDDLHFFTGTATGNVVPPHGTPTVGFGWDYIFQPDGYESTLAALPFELKNEINPRALAIKELKRFLDQSAPLSTTSDQTPAATHR